MNELHKRMAAIVEGLALESRASSREELERLWQAGVETYVDLLELAGPAGPIALRCTACWYLARLEDPEAIPVLVACLQDEDLAVRCEAARCLGLINRPEAVSHLITCLDREPDADVRMYAAHSLGMYRGERVFQALRDTLKRTSEATQVRAMAAESLARHPRAVADLLAALEEPATELRYWAVFALGQLGDTSAIPVLERLRDDHERIDGFPSIAEEVAEALDNLQP